MFVSCLSFKRLIVGNLTWKRYVALLNDCRNRDDVIKLAKEGTNVRLNGWIRDIRLKGRIVTVRYGLDNVMQVFAAKKDVQSIIHNTPIESVVSMIGEMRFRPENNINRDMLLGDVELLCTDMNVLNEASKELPFKPEHSSSIRDATAYQYRYLLLRCPDVANLLAIKSEFLFHCRNFFHNNGFLEVDTPYLYKRTPAGAQEFIVPTKESGMFFSLTQSPQQAKQMLMAGGIPRYFQIARCFRDENNRKDRQPEFNQIDMEMSFPCNGEVMTMIEDMMNTCWVNDFVYEKPSFPLQRLSFKECMEKYGTDKPDLRVDWQIAGHVLTVTDLSLDDRDMGSLQTVLQQKFPHEQYSVDENGNGDLLFQSFCLPLLGLCRAFCCDKYAKSGGMVDRKLSALWVVDCPLFEDNGGALVCSHHPFTAPKDTDELWECLNSASNTALSGVIGTQYDLVMNGNEVGGGSTRIHCPRLQSAVLRALGEDPDQFRHLIAALGSGCPPHGGIALGLERLLAVLCDRPSIRDFMAFPKNGCGRDPLANAPSAIPDDDLKFYNIAIRDNNDE